jgi:hypothetical protein
MRHKGLPCLKPHDVHEWQRVHPRRHHTRTWCGEIVRTTEVMYGPVTCEACRDAERAQETTRSRIVNREGR